MEEIDKHIKNFSREFESRKKKFKRNSITINI